MTKPSPQSGDSIFATVEPLLHEGKAKLNVGEFLDRIEAEDGPGPLLFVLTLPVLFPMPPGVSMLMALPLLIVTPQIMFGRRAMWIPKWLRDRQFKCEALAKVIKRFKPLVQRAEAKVKPRLRFLSGRLGACVVGAVCTLIALVLVLPIPFANLVPSLALGAFAIGLTRRDGVFLLAGYGLVVVAVGVIILGVHGASLGINHLRATLAAAF